ncbi:MAG: M48 family metallopeptidase [Tatlockia sp.]|nr:M48 family metallopeptidase [Tatlockia sp.]
MKINQLEFDGILIELRRKPIKNMTLRIYPPDGRVAISAPLKLKLDFITQQLETKRAWIHKQRELFKARAQAKPIACYESGEKHEFLGARYPLLFLQTEKEKHVILKDEIIYCFSKKNLIIAERQKLLESWYQQQMKAVLPELFAKWETIIGVSASSWNLRKMRSRWGSCHPVKKQICLNLNLIKKPLSCIEYVLVHELVHLLEASHNKRFHALMDKFLPEWRSLKLMLSQGEL